MTAYTWNATNGGAWTTASDWTPSGVPGAADTALFDLGVILGSANGSYQYTVTGNASAASVTVDCDYVSFAGTLTLGAGQASAALIGIDGAYVDILPTASVTTASTGGTGLSFASGTTLEIDGQLHSSGGTLDAVDVTGTTAVWNLGSDATVNSLLVNNGATFDGPAVFNAGGSFDLDTSALLGADQLYFNQGGAIYVAEATNATTGAYNIQNVSTEIGAGNALSLGADPGVSVSIAGGISGAGGVDVSGSDYIFTAANAYTGFTQVDTGGTLTLQGPGAAGSGPIFLDSGMLITQAGSQGDASGETVVGGGGDDTVAASSGALVVFAGSSNTFTFQGGAGASTVIGGSGVLSATGGSAGDVIFAGSSGQDSLTSGTGPTTIAGGGGVFTAIGSAQDVLVAAGGNTTLNGAGSTGNNVFFTQGDGNTVTQGGNGITTIVALGAANTIMGAAGTQDIFLVSGTATLEFTSGVTTGLEKVAGFTATDTIDLVNFAAGTAQAVLSAATVSGGSTFLMLPDSTEIALFGFTGLTAANFG